MDIKIRFLKTEDSEQVLKLIQEFCNEGLGDFGLSFDRKTLETTIQIFSTTPQCIAIVGLIDEQIKGIIAGTIQPSLFDMKEQICEEKIWYVTKNARGTKLGFQMLKLFEDYVQIKGAKRLIMVNIGNINNGVMKRFYERKGYRELETHFIKQI